MIIKKEFKNLTKFKDLKIGDVFKYGEDYYIRSFPLLPDNLDPPIVYNVFQLDNACNYHMSDNTLVKLVEYEFIVKI